MGYTYTEVLNLENEAPQNRPYCLISPGHIARSWSSCSGPLPEFQKPNPKLKLLILDISMQPVFYYLAFCIANHFILRKSTRKQVNDPN